MFRGFFSLGNYTVAELEQGLLFPDNSPLFLGLIWRLVYNRAADLDCKFLENSLKKTRELHSDRWPEVLAERYEQVVDELEPPSGNLLAGGRQFSDLSVPERLEVLAALCQWQLDNSAALHEDCRPKDEEEAASLRAEPLGKDDQGHTYWRFASEYSAYAGAGGGCYGGACRA